MHYLIYGGDFRYSDKTYQINDINWDATPMSTFDYRGEQITFVDYYKKVGYLDFIDFIRMLNLILFFFF